MTPLNVEDFCTFFSEVYGQMPFPWQTELTRHLLVEREWPDLVDIPTGMGKTALLDIAVFIAAATSKELGVERLGRRRLFFVVDRRIVVDEAYSRGLHISQALHQANMSHAESVTKRVAVALSALAPDLAKPLSIVPPMGAVIADQNLLPVTRMRGGVTWNAAWLDRPDRPGIIVGTVDQIGSRMLFRGYGVSDRRKPIDAALVGTDSLILVDEAHLAEVMVSTVMESQRRDRGTLGLPPATLVQLSATHSTSASRRTFSIDLPAHLENDTARRRLLAPKKMHLVESDTKHVVETMVGAALSQVQSGSKSVLVVCNTVDRARHVHSALYRRMTRRSDLPQAAVTLLIGRSRPADRKHVVQYLLDRFGVGTPKGDVTAPAILVATQTVEVGVNLDADALVTESAPWSSLVQRLGRLNRFGDYLEVTPASVIHDGSDDLVYGSPRNATWQWLKSLDLTNSGIDVSPVACRGLTELAPFETRTESRLAPLVTTPILDGWTRTAPIPVPDAPVAPYLHGLGREPATVSIAWRSGMAEPDPASEDDAERSAEQIDADLSMLPILPDELVEVPLYAARAWLRGERASPLSDLDDEDDSGLGRPRVDRDPFRAMTWRYIAGDRTSSKSTPEISTSGVWVWIEATDLRPGDVLIVPIERGGLDEFGWAPSSRETVLDVADVVRFDRDRAETQLNSAAPRRRVRLDSLTPGRLGLLSDDSIELRQRLYAESDDDRDSGISQPLGPWLAEAVNRVLQAHPEAQQGHRLPGIAWTPADLVALQKWAATGVTAIPVSMRTLNSVGASATETLRRPTVSDRFILLSDQRTPADIERDDEQPECSSMGRHPVTLRAHHTNVGDRARDIAAAIGLPLRVAIAVEAAARWHDLGKLDPRFQAMLCGGSEIDAVLCDEPLAKSGFAFADRSAYRAARIQSKLPAGARHEAWSAGLVARYLDGDVRVDGVDPDLVVHLVASHHGHARPWLPPVLDRRPTDLEVTIEAGPAGVEAKTVHFRTEETVDFEHPRRFALLNDRYGRWGLSLLESIVRCADMTVSGEGS